MREKELEIMLKSKIKIQHEYEALSCAGLCFKVYKVIIIKYQYSTFKDINYKFRCVSADISVKLQKYNLI